VASVDDKIVAISFESTKFEQGVNSAVRALDKLKKSLNFPEAGKGLSSISDAFKRLQLGRVGQAVDNVKNKLSALRLVGIAVLSNLVIEAVHAGARMIKALTLDPIMQGYHEYETKLTAIQTILSNTHAAGVKLKDVTKALNELNTYADKTIYNFSEMTRNVGTFTAAGVDLTTAVASIKGIANLAAVSGSNAEQASTAMYQLSQAISAGTVKLQDWNSVVNAGMGGTLFQRALTQTAEHMGTLKKGAVTLTGAMKNVTINGESFRQSLASAGPGKKSWLTSDVLTSTLKQLSGDMTDNQLKAEGYTDAQIKLIQTQAKMAVQAATQVKTLSQLLDTTKEAIGSGWAQTWELIFGNFGEARTLFTGLSNAINGFVSANAAARNKVLSDWKALGGRTVLISALKQAFHDLAAVVKPIKDAFRDIFPAKTGKDLYNMTLQFKRFTEMLMPSPATVENLRRTFRGLFALLDIGKQIVSGIFIVMGKFFQAVGVGSGGFLDLTGSIGDFLVSVDQALKKGDRLHNFFVKMGDILAVPVKAIGKLRDALLSLFSGFSPGAFSGQLDSATQAVTPLQKVVEALTTAWANFLDGFSNTGQVLQPAVDAIVTVIQGLGPAINAALSNMNFEAILAVIRTGLFGALVVMFRQFLGKGSLAKQLAGAGGGILGNIAGSFKALEGSMVALQQNIKAKTLKEIAIAVALLSLSIVALSFVDPKKLNASLVAITFAFAQLLGAMAIMDKIGKSGGFIKMPIIAGSLILLAGAIDILAIAVIALSRLSWGELVKGLGAVGFLLAGIAIAVKPLSSGSIQMVAVGVGLNAIAVALNILAFAVAKLGGMDTGTLAKGLGAIAIALTAIGLAAKLMPANMLITGAGLVAVAFGLQIIAKVVQKFGGMDWRTIGKGMIAIGGALVVIAGAMQLMPTNMIVTAAGLLIVSFALGKIAAAVQSMGGMSIGEIAKGLGTLAASLGILAIALYAMSGAIGGAVALGVAAAGLALLAPALVVLGKQSWTSIIKGLVALAAVFIVIGAAAALLTPAIPAMIGLGAALILIGAGLALAGAGIALIGIGLSAIVVAAPTAVGIIVQAFVQLQEGIIKNAKLLILGLLQIVEQVAKVAPKFADALVKILGTLIDALIKLSPKVVEAMNALLDAVLAVISQNQGKIIQAGFSLILALLQGIKQNIGQIVTAVVSIVVKFLQAIGNNLNRIIIAGGQLLLSLIKGIARYYAMLATAGLTIIAKFVGAIANNIGKVVSAGLNIVVKLVGAISRNVGKLVAAGSDAVVKFITGVGNAGPRIITAATNAIIKFINALQKNANKLAAAGGRAIIAFLNGIATTIDQQAPQMRAAGIRIGVALVDGMTFGLASKAAGVIKKAGDLVGSVKRKLEVWKSPPFAYGEFLGQSVVLGLAQGLSDNAEAVNVAGETSRSVIDMFNTVFQTASPSKVTYAIGRDVINGFALGLKKGTQDDIKQAFADLRQNLLGQAADLRKQIADEKQKIAELRKGKETKEETAEIKALTAALNLHKLELIKVTEAQGALSKGQQKNKKDLVDLANRYAALGDKIELVRGVIKDFQDQYAALPQIETVDSEGQPLTGAQQLDIYTKALTNQVGAVQQYNATLQQLRALGLDDNTYKMLLAQGTSGEAFAESLLAGGAPAIASINKLDSQLDTAAGTLGEDAAANLYNAGKKAAEGLIAGLLSDQEALKKSMTTLVNTIVNAIKKKLKIKSPSEVFADIGALTMEGLAKGFSDSTKVVTKAVDQAAQDALTQMRKSMSDVSNVVLEQLNPNPVITPILDLTQVQARKAELDALTNVVPITAAVSTNQASAISAGTASAEGDQTTVAPGGTSFKFEQNNYSPEALSDIEIYRKTKNQLSLVKSALAIT